MPSRRQNFTSVRQTISDYHIQGARLAQGHNIRSKMKTTNTNKFPAPPFQENHPIEWLKKNFSTWYNTLLTMLIWRKMFEVVGHLYPEVKQKLQKH